MGQFVISLVSIVIFTGRPSGSQEEADGRQTLQVQENKPEHTKMAHTNKRSWHS